MDAEYVESKISRHLHAKAAAAGIPLSGTFELTPCCNLSCKMCYVRKPMSEVKAEGGLMDAAQWIELARVARDRGMLYLLLTGGEPLTHPQFKEIYTACRSLGLVVAVNTNGTLIDEDMLKFFSDNPPSRINMTLYGSSRETYGALCGMPEAYDRAINAIKGLTSEGVTLKLNCSVTKYNRHEIEDILNISREYGVILQATSYMFPPLRRIADSVGENDRLSPEEDARCTLEIEKMRMSHEDFRRRCEDRIAGVLPMEENECMDAPSEHIRCRAGSTSFWIKWNGDINGCGMLPQSPANVKDSGFDAAWEKVREDTAKILMPAECTACTKRSSCVICAAACLCESGAFDKKPENLCKRTDAILDLCRKELENES